jgi:ribosomal protein L11 methyltransferase
VLMEMASDLHRLIVPGGLAVLSGLLDRDAGMVAAFYKEKGWILIEEMQDKEWMALVFRYE